MRFVDICLVAKDFCERHPSRAIDQNTRQLIYEGSDTLLTDVANDISQGKIYLDSVRGNDKLLGMLVRYSDHVDINISSSLNLCWARFVTAKELCHLLIDTEDDHFTKDLIEHISSLIASNIQLNNHALKSETAAILLACELMMPFAYNDTLISDERSYRIALDYSMPEKMIDMMRSEWYQSTRIEAYK